MRRDDQIQSVAIMHDASGLIRLATSPRTDDDEQFATHPLDHLIDPVRRALPAEAAPWKPAAAAQFES